MQPHSNFSLPTKRLIIRSWRNTDRDPYASINADPEVREFLGKTMTRTQSDAQISVFEKHERAHGYTFWAVELPNVAVCIGFVGLQNTDYSAHYTPAIELGWRLGLNYWGQGYATEAADAVLKFGFERLGLDEIVAVTVPDNVRSQSVMTKLGMTYSPSDDFDHPDEAPSHPLQRSVLYRMRKVIATA